MTITKSTFDHNTAGGVGGAVSIVQSSLTETAVSSSLFVGTSGKSSGAVFLNQGSANGVPSTIENCTFIGNTSIEGPGTVYGFLAELKIVNSTFHLNGTASTSVGAHLAVLPAAGSESVVGHTVFGETLEGLACSYMNTSLGYNLSVDESCFNQSTGDLVNTASGLGGILGAVNYKTVVMPVPGSAVIDSGDPAGCLGADGSPLVVDQRDLPRPADGDNDGEAICDRGSVEVSSDYDGIFIDGFEAGAVDAWSSWTPFLTSSVEGVGRMERRKRRDGFSLR